MTGGSDRCLGVSGHRQGCLQHVQDGPGINVLGSVASHPFPTEITAASGHCATSPPRDPLSESCYQHFDIRGDPLLAVGQGPLWPGHVFMATVTPCDSVAWWLLHRFNTP